MLKKITSALFLLVLASANGVFASENESQPSIPVHVMTISVNEHGGMAIEALRKGMWWELQPATEEELQAVDRASKASQDEKREYRSVTVRALDAMGRVIYRTIVSDVATWHAIPTQNETGEPIQKMVPVVPTAFNLAIPYEAASVTIDGWQTGSHKTFDLVSAEARHGRYQAITEDTQALFVTKPNRVNILVVSEGYTTNQKPDFLRFYDVFHDTFLGLTPYSRYQNFFNVEPIFVASVDSGVDHPQCNDSSPQKSYDPKEGQVGHNTAFGATFCWGNTQRALYFKDESAAHAKIAALVNGSFPQVVMAIVNDDFHGGMAMKFAAFSTDFYVGHTSIHELAHIPTFTGLADEYEYGGVGTGLPCSETDASAHPCEPNITTVSSLPQVKWSRWFDPAATPICPENAHYDQNGNYFDQTCNDTTHTGLFEGAGAHHAGVYRAEFDCAMRRSNPLSPIFNVLIQKPYCRICRETIVRRIWEITKGPVGPDEWREPKRNADINRLFRDNSWVKIGQTITLGADSMRQLALPAVDTPDEPPYEIKWYRDGQIIDGENNRLFNYTPSNAKTSILSVNITDKTPFVREGSETRFGVTTFKPFPSETFRWSIRTPAETKAVTNGTDLVVKQQTLLIPKGSSGADLEYEVITNKTGGGQGATWTIDVGYATKTSSGSVSTLAASELPFSQTNTIYASDKNFKNPVGIHVDTSAGDVELVVSISIKNNDNDTTVSSIQADLVQEPVDCGNECDICLNNPNAPGCRGDVVISSAEVLPIVGTNDGDSSYFSISSWLDRGRTAQLQMSVPANTTSVDVQTEVMTLDDASLGVIGSHHWPVTRNNDKWTIDLRGTFAVPPYISVPESQWVDQFKYRLTITVHTPDDDIVRVQTLDHITSGENPADPRLIDRPLHALWKEPKSHAIYHYWGSLALHNWMKGYLDALQITTNDRIADENGAWDTPPRHQWGTATTELPAYMPHFWDDKKYNHTGDFKKFRQKAIDAAIRPASTDGKNGRRDLVDYVTKTRAHVERIIANSYVGQYHLGTGMLCSEQSLEGGGISDNWQQELLMTGIVTYHGNPVLDLSADVGAWNPDWAFKLVFDCDASMYSDIDLDRCRIGQTPGPCTGRPFLIHTQITVPPQQATIDPSQSVTLAVTAVGSDLHYRWFKGLSGDFSKPISDSDHPTITVTPATTLAYWVYVWGADGSASSPEAIVTVRGTGGLCEPPAITDQPPSERIIAAGQAAYLAVATTGTNLGYQWYRSDWIGGTVAPVAGATWNNYAASGQGVYFVRVSNDCGTVDSATSTVIRGISCRFPGIIGVVQDTMVVSGSPLQLWVGAQGEQPLNYTWYQATPSGQVQTVGATPEVTIADPQDGNSYWVSITNTCGHAVSQPATVYVCSPPKITTQPAAPPLFTVENQSAPIGVSATGSHLSYQWFHGGAPEDNNSPASLVTASRAMQTYVVRITNECGSVDSVTVVVPPICDPPSITQQPQSAVVLPSATAHLTVTARGHQADNSDVAYQWYRGNAPDKSNPVTGQTTASLDVVAASTTPVPYWVEAKGTCNTPGDVSKYSTTATVASCSNPVIDEMTQVVRIQNGQQGSLTVVGGGTALTYRWYEGASGDITKPLSGATLHAIAVAPPASTSYWARIYSQGVCSIDTPTIPVYVCNPPPIVTQPAAQTIGGGGNATLTVTTDADAPNIVTHYQWYKGAAGDASVPVGTDSPTLNTGALTNDTSYWVRVFRDSCVTDSAAAMVTVCNLAASIDNRVEIALGSTARINSYVSNIRTDPNMMYQWYRGNVGDRTNLVSGGPSASIIDVTLTTTTNYWLEVSDGTCTTTSNVATVAVCIPHITAQPQARIVPSGTAATLSVSVDMANVGIQWYTGSPGNTANPVSGATAATATVTPTSTTSYWARITSSCGAVVDSAAATVTVCAPPSVSVTYPTIYAVSGQPAAMNVFATGTNLTYQWYSGTSGNTSSPISGSTAYVQTRTLTQTSQFWCRVWSDGTCSADSQTITVDVCDSPSITTQPANATIASGQPANLAVSATSSSGTMTYQWYRGASGDLSSAVTGATGATLNTGVLTADATYWVRVTRGACHTDSATATVTVCNMSVSTFGASARSGQVVTLTAAATGAHTASPSFLWYLGNSGDISHPITSGVNLTSINYSVTSTSNYWVQVTDAGCSANSANATISVCIPTITTQPQDTAIAPASQATLSVSTTGSPLTYQWYIGPSGTISNPIQGATGSSVTVSPSANTTYWVKVSGCGGTTASSNAATVTVCTAPTIAASPQLLTPNAGQTSTLSVTASGANPTYQWYVGTSGTTTTPFGTSAAAQNAGPQQTTDYWVKVTSSCGIVNSPSVKVSVTPIIGVQPADVSITSGTSAAFSVSVSGAQLAYQWYRGAAGDMSTPISGATTASYTTPALTSNATYWVRITSGIASAQSTAATAHICQGPSAIVTQSSGAPSGSPVTLSVTNPNGTDTYKWYRGTPGDTTNFLADTGTASSYIAYPTQDTTYWVRSTSATCYANSAAVPVTICTPKITQQPASTGVIVPNSATLTVSATGNPTLAYQWYIGNSGTTTNPINGATLSSLTVAPTSNTNYWVKVTNGTGGSGCSVNSSTATVTVCTLPTITTQPSNAYVPQGWTSTTVGVNATGATSYTWYQGQSGDTSHFITGPLSANTATIYPGVTNYYWCRVANACGYRDSNACLVSVYPSIYSAPQDVNLTAGSYATFTVSAGGNFLHYQWIMNGANVGTDSPTYTSVFNASASIQCNVSSGSTVVGTWANVNICSGPNVTYGPTKSGSGSCRTLTVLVDDPSATYQWYRGARGDTSVPVSTSNVVNVCPATSTNYWCRITSPDSSCYTDSSVITVP